MDVTAKNSTTKNNTFAWREDVSVQRLLDVVVGILAEEYIEVVKNNPEFFKNKEK